MKEQIMSLTEDLAKISAGAKDTTPGTTLTEGLAKINADARDRIPGDMLATITKGTEELAASGIVENALGQDDEVPDFSLPNANGDMISLSALLAEGPVVISFYRGGWCPYCNLELKSLQDRLGEIKALGANLVGISPEIADEIGKTVNKDGLEFDVLSDLGNGAARKFGLVFTLSDDLKDIYQKFGIDLVASNGDASYELPIPATYVIARDGKIAKAYVDPEYTHRLDPDEIIESLKSL
jgi:peroxiredoxin